jgi:hypothetical protein
MAYGLHLRVLLTRYSIIGITRSTRKRGRFDFSADMSRHTFVKG